VTINQSESFLLSPRSSTRNKFLSEFIIKKKKLILLSAM
jgi:hypothetical protein